MQAGLASLVGSFVAKLGGPLGSGLSAVVQALMTTRTKAQLVKTDPRDPLAVFPQESNYGLAANQASGLFGARGILGAGAFSAAALGLQAQVEISLKGEAGDLFAAKVATVLGRQNTLSPGGAL